MSLLVPIMMFGWIPVVIGLFSKLPARRAVIASFLFAWLFLPMAKYPIPGLPDYTKMSATCWGVLIAAIIFDNKRLVSFKLRSIDLPMIIWCLCPFISSLTNNLGLYDGISGVLAQTVTWGFPYFIGRVYFTDLESLREFAIGIFIGGLIYMPFCLYEIRMSPQLHMMFYGFSQHSFIQTVRYDGWRPMVFMQHGLAVGMWMISASLVGVCLWVTGTIKKLFGIPLSILILAMIITSVLARSTGAIVLFLMGTGIIFVTRKLKTNILIICLLIIPALYLSVRAPGYWDGDNLAHFLYDNFNKERALSLYERFDNENMLTEKAMQKSTFGWGGWGRARVYDDQGNDITVADSFWIITFGNYGLVGLASITCAIVLPIAVLLRRHPARDWFNPMVAPAAVLAILLGLYMIDNLLNAMPNPIFIVAAGGINSLAINSKLIKEGVMEKISLSNRNLTFQPRFL